MFGGWDILFMGGQDATPSPVQSCLWAGKMPPPPCADLLMGGQDATPSQCRLAYG